MRDISAVTLGKASNFCLAGSAEAALRQEEQKPGFSLQLLQITATDSFPYNIRLASALCFKNFIKRNWTNEDGNYKLPLDEVATIKRELINLMISVPSGIQTQLGEAVSAIADSDFWERWDTLVDVRLLLSSELAGIFGLTVYPHSRISFRSYPRTTLRPISVSCRWHTPSLNDGAHFSSPTSYTERSTMCSRNSEPRSWRSSR